MQTAETGGRSLSAHILSSDGSLIFAYRACCVGRTFTRVEETVCKLLRQQVGHFLHGHRLLLLHHSCGHQVFTLTNSAYKGVTMDTQNAV